tara:strand:- start:345 stop:887 length:543 start_codon:yes stop_codon:yes gene_type:complete
MRYIFIDIRKSDEVYNKRFAPSGDYGYYNIPMDMIRFNQHTIRKHLEYANEIYIVCRSVGRSQYIKDKYFANDANIKISKDLQFNNLNYGDNLIKINNDTHRVKVEGMLGINFYSIMRIVQTFLGLLILILGGLTYMEMSKYKNANVIPLVILMVFGLMALVNGLTSTCTLSLILQDYLN